MKALRDHLLHMIDGVLAQPLVDETHRAEAVSLKKLLKGDGSWATRKLILGWIINTLRQTLEIPAYRKAMLAEIFDDLKGQKRVGRKAWQSKKQLNKNEVPAANMVMPFGNGCFLATCYWWLANSTVVGYQKLEYCMFI